MSKERVQAKLAFNGCLKPVERKPAKARTSTETEIVILDCQQRVHNGGNGSKRSTSDKKRSCGALQQGGSERAGPAQVMQSSTAPSREAKRSKPFVDKTSCSEEKAMEPNPVFALAARRRVAEANRSVRSRSALVDVTAGPIRAQPIMQPPTIEVSRTACQLSDSLPPVHILQGSPFSALHDCTQPGHQLCLNRHKDATYASGVCTGNLQEHLQQEVITSSVSAEVSKLLNDSIADFMWEDASARADSVKDASTSDISANERLISKPPDNPIGYMQAVLRHAGFQAYACDPTSAVRWQKQIALMMGNSADHGADQHPWTAKYAPQASEQVLANSDACTRLRQWLSREQADKPGPTECDQILLKQVFYEWHKSGFVSSRTESCAVSSWKADSEDSDFIESKATRRCSGPGGMLLTGPSGSGKSAAVYACAQELHMNVLEICPGMERSGSNLVKLVGEATQSHTVICKATPLEEINQPNQGDLTACHHDGGLSKNKLAKKKAVRQGRSAKTRIPPPEQRCLTGAMHSGATQMKEQNIARSRTLLLFEDFDQLLDQEDEGFINSLGTLLLESKIPVLLLSESPNAEDLLHRAITGGAKLQSARLYAPPLRCILEYLALVCVCERVAALPTSLMQLACSCNGDLRSALNQLQFIVDHCSTIEPVSEDSPMQHSWRDCKWTVINAQLAVPAPLSALCRAQPWQVQPNSMVWGVNESQGSTMQACLCSGDSSATEWALSLLVDYVLGESLQNSGAERVDAPQPNPHAPALHQGDEHEHQHSTNRLPCDSRAGLSKLAEARSSTSLLDMGRRMLQNCEFKGSRILAAWAEHLRVKQSRAVKQQKRKRNGSGSAAELQGGVKKQCKFTAASTGWQENPANAASHALSGASDLQDDVPVLSMDEGGEGITVPSRCVLDDDEDDDVAVDVHARDSHDQIRSSASAIQLPNATDDVEVHAMPVDNFTAVDSALGTDQAKTSDAPVISETVISPHETSSALHQAMVENPGSLPAEQGLADCDMQAKSLQRPVPVNAATLVLKQAASSQKLYILHLQELAAGMRTAGSAMNQISELAHCESVCHAEANQSAVQQPVSGQQVPTTDLDAVVRAAEAASALEALSGRCSQMLDQQDACASARDSIWAETHGVSRSTCAAAKDATLTVPSAASGAQISCKGAALDSGDGVYSTQLSAVLEGVNEAAVVCFSDKGSHGRLGCAFSMQQAVKQSVTFRRGSRLCGANIVQDIRRVFHCDTHSSTVIRARGVITMAASECLVASKQGDKHEGSCARRSRRQRQRGHCEEFLHRFDFNLSQFVDAQLVSTLHV